VHNKKESLTNHFPQLIQPSFDGSQAESVTSGSFVHQQKLDKHSHQHSKKKANSYLPVEYQNRFESEEFLPEVSVTSQLVND
jgi:hypothetical protein